MRTIDLAFEPSLARFFRITGALRNPSAHSKTTCVESSWSSKESMALLSRENWERFSSWFIMMVRVPPPISFCIKRNKNGDPGYPRMLSSSMSSLRCSLAAMTVAKYSLSALHPMPLSSSDCDVRDCRFNLSNRIIPSLQSPSMGTVYPPIPAWVSMTLIGPSDRLSLISWTRMQCFKTSPWLPTCFACLYFRTRSESATLVMIGDACNSLSSSLLWRLKWTGACGGRHSWIVYCIALLLWLLAAFLKIIVFVVIAWIFTVHPGIQTLTQSQHFSIMLGLLLYY